MAQTKDGSRIIIDTGIVTPDTEQLVRHGGMSMEAARLIRKDETPGSGIIRPQGKPLPVEFAGAVIIGEPRDTKIILSGSFVTASGGIITPSTEDVANINRGTFDPKLAK